MGSLWALATLRRILFDGQPIGRSVVSAAAIVTVLPENRLNCEQSSDREFSEKCQRC
jgi:hypothetical protein